MYTADTTVLSKDRYPGLFGHLEGSAELSKCLYNAALFRIRQVFTGWDKEDRSENEKAVFCEIAVMKEVYPDIKAGRVLSYRALDHAREWKSGLLCRTPHADSPADPEGGSQYL